MTIEMTKTDLRNGFIAQVQKRLIGPFDPAEELQERPNKRYLTGMVFPQGASAAAGLADEQQDAQGAEAEDGEGLESPTDILFQRLPASVGMTFAILEEERRRAVDALFAPVRDVLVDGRRALGVALHHCVLGHEVDPRLAWIRRAPHCLGLLGRIRREDGVE